MFYNRLCYGVGAVMGSVRSVMEPLESLREKPCPPRVSRGPADAVASTGLGETERALLHFGGQVKTEGARTVLVLESNDIANTNDQVIAKTLSRLSQEAKTELRSVDEMYLVETEANMWCVWLLKYDAAYRPVGDGSSWDLMWDRIEVDESFLIDVVEDDH